MKNSKMKNTITIFFFLTFIGGLVNAVERKVDENGNEYFIVSGGELETTYRKPVAKSKALVIQKEAVPSYKEIALQMKSGCTATGDIGEAGAAVVNLDDFFVVIPTRPNGLPPHPGENGKLTIHGVDSDNDCVRDDIEHFIVNKFGAENQENIRKYLFEYAIWLDFFLINGLSQNSARTADVELAKAGLCLNQYLGNAQASLEVNALFAEFHNTFDRSHRYIDNVPRIAGWSRRSVPNVSCA